MSSRSLDAAGIRSQLNKTFGTGNWRELLLGPWCVSRYVWLLQSLLGIPIIALRLRGVTSLTGFDLIGALLIGPLLAGVVLWIASVTVLRGRFRAPQSALTVVAVWLLADCVRGLSAATYLHLRNATNSLTPGQVIAGIFFLFGWTVLLTYVIASSNFYRLRSLDADALIEVTRTYETRRALVVERESTRLNSIIRDWLIPELDALSLEIAALRQGSTPRDWSEIAERTGGIVIDQVRTASREVIVEELELAELEPKAQAFGNRWSIFFSDLRSMELSVWLAIAIYSAFGALVAIPRLGPVGYALTLAISGSGLLLLLLGREILRLGHSSRARGLLTTLVYLATGLIVALMLPWFPGTDQISTMGLLQAFIVIFAVVGGVAASAIRQYQQRWEIYFQHQLEMLEHYRRLDAELAREQLRVRRQASRLLHGPVQGNLAAMTLCLKLHAARPAVEFTTHADAAVTRTLGLLDEAQATLHSTLIEPVVTEISTGVYLGTLRSAWSGLMRIECIVSPEVLSRIDAVPGQRTTIIAILEEAVTNASRHGDARNLSISMNAAADDEHVTLMVDNDGVPVADDFQAGFGLRAFDAFGVQWSLTSTGNHSSRLEVSVPLT